MNTVTVADKIVIGNGKLALIGGPCMAESLEVCMETAEFLTALCKKLDIQYIFKASYDKANRSSGTSRRGPGRKAGLGYLAAVREKFNVPVLTDIHESAEVPEVAEVVDVLQIPAFLCRQTDLLLAAGKSGLPVNIKKGQFMAPQVMLTERGSSFGYHNLVVDFRSLPTMRAFDVPVIFDATHSVQLPGGLGNASGGQREYIYPLALAAAATGIDAIFCEVHPNPVQAFSDGPNSLDFAAAEQLLAKVKAIHDLV